MSDDTLHQVNRGRIHWTDDEIESYHGTIEILTNGWVRVPETKNLYPPQAVVEVVEYE